MCHFYPRSPCGERRGTRSWRLCNIYFYPRSPCGERQKARVPSLTPKYFYPRSPCGERLQPKHEHHNPRYFYPRSPCGERPPRLARVVPTPIFLSTLSLRRATQTRAAGSGSCAISIHALLAESDPYIPLAKVRHCISIHALLAESDTPRCRQHLRARRFLSTLSLRRATPVLLFSQVPVFDFYPRSPCGERQ